MRGGHTLSPVASSEMPQEAPHQGLCRVCPPWTGHRRHCFPGARTVLAEPKLLREASRASQSGSPAAAGRRLCGVHAAKCEATCGAECSPQLQGVTVGPVRLSTSKAPSFHWGPRRDTTAI